MLTLERRNSLSAVRMYRCLLAIFTGILCIAIPGYAQNVLYKHYTVKDGLPSNKIYGIIEDNEGRIWIGTDKGIARFNGKQFTVFTTANGLRTNDVMYFFPDPEGRIWIHDYTPYLSYIKNDTVHSFQVMPANVPFNKLNFTYHNGLVYTAKYTGELVAGGNSSASVLDILTYRHRYVPGYDSLRNFSPALGHHVFNYNGRSLVLHDYLGISYHNMKDGSSKAYPYETKRDSFPFNTHRFAPLFFRNKYLFSLESNRQDSLTFLEFATGAYRKIPVGKAGSTAAVLRGFDSFKDEVQFTTSQGLTIIDTNLQVSERFNLPKNLSDITLNTIYKDHNNGYWISTHSDGVYLISRELNKYRQLVPDNALQESAVLKLYLSNGKYYLFNKKNELIVSDSSFHILKKLYLPSYSSYSTDQRRAFLVRDGETGGHFIISSRGIFYLTADNQLRAFPDFMDSSFSKGFAEYQMNTIKGCLYDKRSKSLLALNHVVVFKLSYVQSRFHFEMVYLKRYTNISRGANNEVWLSDDIGNLSIFDSTLQNRRDYNIGSSVTNQTSDALGQMIMVIDGKGMFCYKNGSLNVQQVYAGTDIQAIKADTSGLWAATNNSVHHYIYQGGKYRLRATYPNIDGQVYEEVYAIELKGNKLVLICDKGIVQIERNDNTPLLDSTLTQTLRIYAIGVGPSDMYYYPAGTKSVQTNYTGGNTSFLITCNSTPFAGDVSYQYFLEGKDLIWQSTSQEDISYSSLPPGSYTLHLKANVQHTNIGSGDVLYRIEVLPAWWQTWWFRSLLVLLGMGMIAAAVLYIIRRNKNRALQKAEIDKRMAGLELTALQAQMNPHFIFNALSSIQSFINSHDTRGAEELLQKFSMLIRLYLEFSRHQFITLRQELKVLELYTAIERMRFGNRFDVVMRTRGEHADKVLVPPMLVQPLVENAINHGLYHKKEKGLLKVIILIKKDCTIIVVDDDGIGREAARKLRRKLFPSRGNQILKDRIETLQLSGIAEASMKITDKTDKFGNNTGTRVILTLQTNGTTQT